MQPHICSLTHISSHAQPHICSLTHISSHVQPQNFRSVASHVYPYTDSLRCGLKGATSYVCLLHVLLLTVCASHTRLSHVSPSTRADSTWPSYTLVPGSRPCRIFQFSSSSQVDFCPVCITCSKIKINNVRLKWKFQWYKNMYWSFCCCCGFCS